MRKGSHQSKEAKQKISKSMIEVRKTINPMKGRTGERHQNFGKHWNAEVRKRCPMPKKENLVIDIKQLVEQDSYSYI